MSTSAPTPAPGKNPPLVTIDVLPKDVGQLRKLKVGDGIKVVLHGEVKEVSEREPSTGFPVDFAGSLRLEVSQLDIFQWNDFAALADLDD